ncbi:MAG: hypothetical protein ACYTHN_07520 [Planctomycetota bacterium]
MKKANRKKEGAGSFDHERLDVYRLALEYLAHAHAKPRGSKDRHNYFRRAAGSTTESSGAWDVARIREFCSIQDAESARKMLLSIFNMLRGLIG